MPLHVYPSSSTNSKLKVPIAEAKSFGTRTFIYVPEVWNELPSQTLRFPDVKSAYRIIDVKFKLGVRLELLQQLGI